MSSIFVFFLTGKQPVFFLREKKNDDCQEELFQFEVEHLDMDPDSGIQTTAVPESHRWFVGFGIRELKMQTKV